MATSANILFSGPYGEISAAANSEVTGQTISRYRIFEKLGESGVAGDLMLAGNFR